MAKLEYDEDEGTFTYFLVLLYGLFLLIASYFLWPGLGKDDSKDKKLCQCGPCCRKRTKMESEQPFKKVIWFLRIAILVVLWAVLFYLVYWALTQERNYIEWDPFEVLQLDREASKAEIRKQYRELSKKYHPDKETGDQEMFMKIAKAYEALTDEESRDNWEKYGNPDGPQAATFGIALPAWIVDKQNSIWVLGLYVLVFMVGMPVIVGTWWYRSVKFGNTNVLIETTRMFMYLLSRAKLIPIKRIVMILATSREISSKQQAGVIDRPSDNIHLNALVKQLPNIKVDTREQPFCRASVAKARLLLQAYLEHIELQDPGLLRDQDCIVKYSPYLINEMINVLCQISHWATMYSGNKRSRQKKIPEPTAELFENVMRFCQMLVQAIDVPYMQLKQLPHLRESSYGARSLVARKKRITTIEEFAALKNNERRHMLRNLSDREYQDIMIFLSNFPHIDMTVTTEVPDDEDTSVITAGSFTTFSVRLVRKGILEHYNNSLDDIFGTEDDDKGATSTIHNTNEDELNDETDQPETIGNTTSDMKRRIQRDRAAAAKASTVVYKPNKKKKKGKGGGAGSTSSGNKKKKVVKHTKQQDQEEKVKSSAKEERTSGADEDVNDEADDDADEDHVSESSADDEEREWKELQKSVKKDKEREAVAKSYPVHAPFFPADKQELWWLYIIDKKKNKIVVSPEKVAGLKKEKEVKLRWMAPERGNYRYTVVLMSDSYLNLFVQQELKIQVHERKEVSGKEQWADLEQEEEEDDVIEESVTESEYSEDD